MIQLPLHVRAANVASQQPLHPWDEWDHKNYYMFAERDQFDRFNALTNAANTALVMAIGEWICGRFIRLDADPRPLQFIEAGWAAIVDPAYCIYTETVDDEWRGPVRAPLAVVIAIANDAIFCLDLDPNVATRVCWMWNLAHHVIEPHDQLDTWFEAIFRRLEQYHTKAAEPNQEDLFSDRPPRGLPVPRAATDPALDYRADAAPALLDAFLRSLSPAENPFLRPAEFIHVPEVPTPYRYTPVRPETDSS
jgi:hypothetical protein